MTTPAELFASLCETTVAGSAAILLVLPLRRPLRRAFGADRRVARGKLGLIPGLARRAAGIHLNAPSKKSAS